MAATAASHRLPNQEENHPLPNQEERDDGEEHLNDSVLFSDHEDWKAAESAAISTNREYREEKLPHQEVLRSSFSSLNIRPQPTGTDIGHSPSEIDDGSRYWQSPIQALHEAAGSSRTKNLALGICQICAEMTRENEMIRVNKTCFHSFCSTCVSKHVKTRITDNHRVTVPCPGLDCKHSVEFESCLGIVPKDVLEAWDRALCESLILDALKFYCPFRDCSAMLVNDNEKVVEESECPHCHRLFCALCRVPWHAGVSCEEFWALSEDERGHEDLMLRQLVAENKWGRCPNCKFFVERTAGCRHITCRCGYEFCYGCGSKWGEGHGGCCKG